MAMLDQDDKDLRKLSQNVQGSLLGRDANKCEDPPHTEEPVGDVKIQVLGNVNGDRAVEALSQATNMRIGQEQEPEPQPAPDPPQTPQVPKRRLRDWLIPLAAGGGLAAAGMGLANYLTDDPVTPVQEAYDLRALPFESYPEN